jgi:BASS family bile acid:Na+ symporter
MSPTAETFSAMTPKVIAAIALIAMMVQLGLALEPEHDKAAKWHKRRLVLRALAFNFGVVPLLALLAQRALGASGPVAIALLVLAASPGGRHAPKLVDFGRGDAGLSVEITLFMNKLNPFLSPLLAAWLLGGHRVDLRELPYIVQLFVLQIVPFYGARLLLKWRPAFARRLARPAQSIAGVAALGVLAWLLANHAFRLSLLLGVRGWLAVILFGAVLLALGWLVGGRSPGVRRAFALASESRNLALALVIANMKLHDDQVLVAIFGAWVILLALGGLFAITSSRLGTLRAPRREPPPPLRTSPHAA